jgi:hypothetical protein
MVPPCLGVERVAEDVPERERLKEYSQRRYHEVRIASS